MDGNDLRNQREFAETDSCNSLECGIPDSRKVEANQLFGIKRSATENARQAASFASSSPRAAGVPPEGCWSWVHLRQSPQSRGDDARAEEEDDDAPPELTPDNQEDRQRNASRHPDRYHGQKDRALAPSCQEVDVGVIQPPGYRAHLACWVVVAAVGTLPKWHPGNRTFEVGRSNACRRSPG